MELFQRFKKNTGQDVKVGIALVVIAALVALLFHASWPLFILSLVLAVMAFRLPESLSKIVSVRIFTVIVALLALLQFEALAFWVLHITASPVLYALATLVIVGAAIAIQYKKTGVFFVKQSFALSRKDIVISLPAIIITGAFWVRVVLPSNSDDVAIVESITHGMDDASHLGMMGDLFRSDENLLSRPELKEHMTNPNHASYPMGWHVSTSILLSSAYDFESKPLIEQVRAYFYTKLFTLFSVVFALSLFTFNLAARIKFKIETYITQILFILSTAAVAFILAVPLYFEGFFSFLPILTFFLLFSAVILGDTKKQQPGVDILMGLMAGASALTWVLTAPILMLSMIVKRYIDVGSVKKLPVGFYVGLGIAAVVTALQIRIMLRANENVAQGIVNSGGITNPTHFLLLACLGLFGFVYTQNKKLDAFIKDFAVLIVPTILVLAGLLLLLSLSSPEITYYYYKLQIVLLVILVPFVCLYLAKALFESRKQTIAHQFASLVIFFSLFALSIPSLIGYEYFANIMNRAQHNVLSDQDSGRVITQSLNRTFDDTNSRVLFFYPDQSPRTILASHLARKTYISSKCDQQIFQTAYDMNAKSLGKRLNECAATMKSITINTDKKGSKELKKDIDKTLIESKKVSITITE